MKSECLGVPIIDLPFEESRNTPVSLTFRVLTTSRQWYDEVTRYEYHTQLSIIGRPRDHEKCEATITPNLVRAKAKSWRSWREHWSQTCSGWNWPQNETSCSRNQWMRPLSWNIWKKEVPDGREQHQQQVDKSYEKIPEGRIASSFSTILFSIAHKSEEQNCM